ncbi:MAG: hypothetical protein Q9202_006904 [Teloschistes flavicans]
MSSLGSSEKDTDKARSAMLTESATLTEEDIEEIWRQRSSVPASIDGCIHDLITEISQQQPDAPAVDAWDGQFSYAELQTLSSKLARQLANADAVGGQVVPILFEKTKWTPVAMLGVIQSGCACVALDTTQPDARLRSILQQIRPKIIVTSATNYGRATSLGDVSRVLRLDDTLYEATDLDSKLPIVSPGDTAYISFTSGTTGTPKGACISHGNVRSTVHHQGRKLGFTARSRVFDFAPYSFDVAWSNFLHTLCAGACMCIAQQDIVLDDLSFAIDGFKATLLNVTPTILRTIHPIPKSLDTVLLSGEMPFRENIVKWSSHVRLLNTYGPTECTFKCAFSILDSCSDDRPDIGVGVGFCTWVVDPNDSSKLAEPDSVGELYLEGPMVGQGYLSDTETTTRNFVQDPPWLVNSHRGFAGRFGRLYRTGDLVRYIQGGKILFIGRKDETQLKIRGQRVELGDVEHHVRACIDHDFPLVADVIQPMGSKDSFLTLFIQTHSRSIESVRTSVGVLPDRLSKVLPSFMIPTLFIPLEKLPYASTGKTDRKRLREWGNSISWPNAVEMQSSLTPKVEHHEPTNEMERRMRLIWASILNLDITSLGIMDNFFQKGGDSVAAIFMVASAREQSIAITVADIFRSPRLCDLAQVARVINDPASNEEIVPFSLIQGEYVEISLRRAAARLCNIDASDVEDIYPCTPLQEGMLALTSKTSGSYVSRKAFKLPDLVDDARFENAWNEVVALAPILRTRIVNLSGKGLVQVVTKRLEALRSYPSVSYFRGAEKPMALGKPLCRGGQIEDDQLFCLDIHHAIFDGWSMKLILNAVEDIYRGVPLKDLRLAPFKPFVQHLQTQDGPDAAAFWESQLAGPEASVFPLTSTNAQPKKDFRYEIAHLHWSQTRFTPSSTIRSAIALLLAAYTNSNNITFGATTSGRQASVAHIEHIAGPTIATTPVRIDLDWHHTVEQLAGEIQEQALNIANHEQYGLQQIRRISPLVRDTSEFQLLLVIQPAVQSADQQGFGLFAKPVSMTSPGLTEVEADAMGIYNPYAMMVQCQMEVDGLILMINHDPGVIGEQQVQRFSRQLETILRQLCSEENQQTPLRELTMISDQDVGSIWEQNKQVPEMCLKPIVQSIDTHAVNTPHSVAISAWDKSISYIQLRSWSSHLADRLQQQGVGMGSIVLLSFEKSAWMAVMMIAVIRTGATALPLSAISSTYDAQELMNTLQPKLAITSVAPESSPFYSLVPVVHISQLVQSVEDSSRDCSGSFHAANQLSDPAVILFTSGSTGAAKGILWSHGTIASNIDGLIARFGLTAGSRVFQFSDYEYDVSNLETFATLAIGGCLCIPTGSDRLNRLASAIRDAGANWACLTPSVADNLSPSEVPLLKTLVCAGEMLHARTALKWVNSIDSFHNWYGPAEAAVATSYLVRNSTWEPGFIGQGSHALCWLVDPQNPERLAPIGAVAELYIEGPILAAEYIGQTSEALNKKAFVSPSWLQQGHAEISGRSGRIYKTGDLVKVDERGRMIILGRSNDSERKLHGRRVDLGEIEKRVQPALSGKIEATVVAEIFSPAKSTLDTLALFVKPAGIAVISELDVDVFVKQHLPVDDIEETLMKTLTSNMIPKLYIPILDVPLTHAGKTDRRRLRQIGGSFTHGQLAKMQPRRREMTRPSSEMEKRLQALWTEIISIEPEAIFSEDSFLQLGGDSVGAMRLVALAHDQGLSLTVANIFEFPRLREMAKVTKTLGTLSNDETPVPFSLLRSGIDHAEVRHRAARLCDVPVSQVVDIFHCTALQEGLLALTERQSGQYVSRSVLRLQNGIDTARVRGAWQATVDKFQILRTRVVDIPGQGLVQVVLNHWDWRSGVAVDEYVHTDEREPMGLATPLCRAALVSHHFILTIHHCLYDGNVLRMILDEVESQYVGEKGMLVTPFQNFIQHMAKLGKDDAAAFWRGELLQPELSQFPTMPAPSYQPMANQELQCHLPLDWPASEMTRSTIIRSAWAILASAYTCSDHVIFGAVVSGRQVDMRGISNCVGPTISSVPIAITLVGDETISELQARVQRQSLAMTPFEQYGLRNIQKSSARMQTPLFQTLLVVQPAGEGKKFDEDSLLFKARTFASNIESTGNDPFNTFALMVICEISPSGLSLRMSYDDRILEVMGMQRMAQQFEKILQQMCMMDGATTKVKDVQIASDADIDFFWRHNANYPEEPTVCVQELIACKAMERPDAVAVDAHDGNYTYAQLELMSNVIARNLIRLGLKSGSVVALCLDKSVWTPVAQLAIWKAGGICMLQPAKTMEKDPDSLFRAVRVQMALLLDAHHLDMVEQGEVPAFAIQQLADASFAGEIVGETLPTRRVSDPATLILSSGTTGEPKQILWSHRALAANVKAHAKAVSLNEESRLCQWTSHNFDVCTVESFSTLAHGGCLCVPSETERLENLAQAVQRFRCDSICLTPSTAKILEPEQVPCLRTLSFAGEKLLQDEVARWQGKCCVLNWYGPSEASTASFSPADDETWRTGIIGRSNSSASTRCWLVDPRNHNRLVPWGAIGELAIEGPALAECYLGDPGMTSKSFRQNLTFLSRRQAASLNQIYLTSDLARCRSNGDLEYLRRNDTVVKIHGNLVALEQIEHSIRQHFAPHSIVDVAADVLTTKASRDPSLVAFLCFPDENDISSLEIEKLTTGLSESLSALLPWHSIPAVYIPVSSIPTTSTGKRDRVRLQEIGASIQLPKQSYNKRHEPITIAERMLREMWSAILQVDGDCISANDSFLQKGDSIQAMRLVGMARQQGFSLTVRDVFQNPKLSEMAKCLKNQERVDAEDFRPFQLLGGGPDFEQQRQHAASLCNVDPGKIEDLYPCTPLQEGLLALSMKRQGDYIGRNVMTLSPSVDIGRFREAWEKVVSEVPILRTRIVNIPNRGLLQTILRDSPCWTDADNLDDFMKKEQTPPIGLGTPLMRCGLFPKSQEHGCQSFLFALTMHHAVYDGVTTSLILETLESLYQGKTPLRLCHFQAFVKSISTRNEESEASYWKEQFESLEATQFPRLPTADFQPEPTSTLRCEIENVAWRADDFTPSTVIRAAWAIVCSQHTSDQDVIFGTIGVGRKAPVAGIERVAGPAICSVPIRVKVNDEQSCQELLRSLQDQATEMISYEQIGLSSIARLSEEAHRACQFQTMLVVQPPEVSIDSSSLFVPSSTQTPNGSRYTQFNIYSLMIVCTVSIDSLHVELSFDSRVIQHESLDWIARHFERVLRQLCSMQDLIGISVAQTMATTDLDRNQCWKWNSNALSTNLRCVQDIIADIAQKQPNAIAISAWDGEVTYDQLIRFSRNIARQITEMGLASNTIVPLYFEKSMWMPIAFLGVVTAGAAALALDPALPIIRLQTMLSRVEPKLILSSVANSKLASKLVGKTFIVGPHMTMMRDCDLASWKKLPVVQPTDLLYVVFTSGSTGTPKGCMIQHQNFSSALLHQGELLGLRRGSRIYDYSSYAFDASYWSTLHAFAGGATLCIPSDGERSDSLAQSVNDYRTTDIFLTPATARLLDPGKLSTLRTVYIGGEAVSKADVEPWLHNGKSTFIVYGPTECSAISLFWKVPSIEDITPTLAIGNGYGVSTWIIDPRSGTDLSPIGSVGELYLEGPLVGQGYLGDQCQTAAAFSQAPPWLMNGAPDGNVAGRSGRLYKTGDLVRCNPVDGTIIFVGRTDTQIKLRGQRIELSEVEYHVRSCADVDASTGFAAVAEIVTPQVTRKPTLVVFIHLKQQERRYEFDHLVHRLHDRLPERLPSYMVPTAYISVDEIPMSAGRKIDRKQLQAIGENLSDAQLTQKSALSKGRPPTSKSEICLQQLWAMILVVPKEEIRADTSFLRIGGDSIGAMRLVSLAQSQGIALTVQNVLSTPRLSEMAKAIDDANHHGIFDAEVVEAFALLKHPEAKDTIMQQAAEKCGARTSQIEDVFPCTGIQKELLSMTAKRPGDCIAVFRLELRDHVDVKRLREAWDHVSRSHAPILRYRIIDMPNAEGLVQVLVNEDLAWDTFVDIEGYLQANAQRSMGLGQPLTRLTIIEGESIERYCLLTQHHAMYDGWSLKLLFEEVSNAYLHPSNHPGTQSAPTSASFQAFRKHGMSIDKQKAEDFWRGQFSGIEAVAFPDPPYHGYQPNADSTLRRNIDNLSLTTGNRDVTASTIIRAAWSILAAYLTASDDVIFGALVTGRQAPIRGIETMIAPLIAGLPIRVTIKPHERVDDLLKRVHEQSVEMIAYEQTEFLDIRRIDADTERATRFNTLIVVQPPAVALEDTHGPFGSCTELRSSNSSGLGNFNPHALLIMCQLSNIGDNLGLELSYDSNVLDSVQVERLAAQFEHVLRQLCESTQAKLEEIDLICPQDRAELWKWNAQLPDAVQVTVQDRIAKATRLWPEAQAICAWNGTLSYKQLDELSSRLASDLIASGADSGMIIALCFEKSMWQPVAALGAIKAGAACVALDVQQPEGRLRTIIAQVQSKIILTSASRSQLAAKLSSGQVFVVDSTTFSRPRANSTMNGHVTRKPSPSDTLYVLFTSGSTGEPKGIVMANEAFSSAVTYQAAPLLVGKGARVFDFVSYSFDITWSNLLNTLIRGACLCIPSEWERMNDFAGAFNRLKANYVHFPPSVAASLIPSTLPELKTIALGGEPLLSHEISRWNQAENVLAIYGPAECAQAASVDPVNADFPNNHVGQPFGARFWLVQPGHPERLAAIGAIGELLVEGPTIAKGYLGDPQKTRSAFIDAPSWLRRATPGYEGRMGRLYRTGDLLRYKSDGTFTFIGRKDGMIKLRGQRVELGEIESHVRASLHDPSLCDAIAAEVITPRDTENPLIAVFVSLVETKGAPDTPKKDMWASLKVALRDVGQRLSESLPRYMVPGAYVPLAEMPITGTNKINRRRLRELGNAQTAKMLSEFNLLDQKDTFRAPDTIIEKSLQALWASTLHMDPSSISADSNFFSIGGESIAAMRLVAAARQDHMSFTVADIFRKPRLCQLAELVTDVTAAEDGLQAQEMPRSNGDAMAAIRDSVYPLLKSGMGTVTDVFPVTAFQRQSVLDALQEPPSRWFHWILNLAQGVNFSRLQWACDTLLNTYDILRTIFVRIDGRFFQAQVEDVRADFEQFECGDDDCQSFVDALCVQDLERERALGSSLIRFMAIKHASGQHRLIFRISHAQFDGYCWPLILERLTRIYLDESMSAPPQFAYFLQYNTQRRKAALAYWTGRLKGSTFPSWSTSDLTPPAREYDCSDRLVMEEKLPMPEASRTRGYSLATVFHAACCIMLSRHYHVKELVIGRLVTGRSMLPDNLQNTIGPCLSEIPIRIFIKPSDTLWEVTERLNQQLIEDSMHEGLGMDDIIQQCTDWSVPGNTRRDFGWRTAFQQGDIGDGFEFLGEPSQARIFDRKLLPRTRPEIYATPAGDALVLSFEGNRLLIEEVTASGILGELRDVLLNL